jgi:hypothetical protein
MHELRNSFFVLAGYFYSTIIGMWMIDWVMKDLVKSVEFKPTDTANNRRAGLVGLVERALYTGSLRFNKPEFLALWLIFKVAGQWKGWTDERGRISSFLIGSGLSIAYGLLGGALIQRLIDGHIVEALGIFVGPLTFICLLKWRAIGVHKAHVGEMAPSLTPYFSDPPEV